MRDRGANLTSAAPSLFEIQRHTMTVFRVCELKWLFSHETRVRQGGGTVVAISCPSERRLYGPTR